MAVYCGRAEAQWEEHPLQWQMQASVTYVLTAIAYCVVIWHNMMSHPVYSPCNNACTTVTKVCFIQAQRY